MRLNPCRWRYLLAAAIVTVALIASGGFEYIVTAGKQSLLRPITHIPWGEASDSTSLPGHPECQVHEWQYKDRNCILILCSVRWETSPALDCKQTKEKSDAQ